MPYAATSPILVSTTAAGQDANNNSTTPVFSPDGGSVSVPRGTRIGRSCS